MHLVGLANCLVRVEGDRHEDIRPERRRQAEECAAADADVHYIPTAAMLPNS